MNARLASLTLALVLLTTACSGVMPGPAADRPAAAPATPGSSHIRLQLWADAEEAPVYEQLVAQYMAANPGRSVELINVPAQGEHMSRLASAFSAGDAPEVFLVNYRRYGQLAASGALEPVAPWMQRDGVSEQDYYPISLDAFRLDGQLQCLPQNLSSLVVYYNRDLFEQQQVALPQAGWTWADFLDAARRLTIDTDRDGVADIHGVGVEPTLIRAAPFIWQAGGDLVDDPAHPTRFTLSDPRARAGLDFFLSLSNVYSVTPAEAEAKAEDMETRFRNGRLAMVLNSRRVVPLFRTIEGFTWDVAPLPMGEQAASVLHSDAYCIAGTAKDKAAAWDFVRYAGGPAGQRLLAELGRIVPSLRALAESPAFLDPARAPASSRVFLDMIPHIRMLPIMPAWPELEKSVNEELEIAFYANSEANEVAGGPEVEAEGGFRPLSAPAVAAIDAALARAQAAGDMALGR